MASTQANEQPYPQTKFFQACRGVFEGGGCRGAGHVGAYEAAIQCGVNFSEVAGTSAGSIVAALIGAGADAKFLRDTCAYLKFNELLVEPKGRIASFSLGRIGGFLLRGKKRLFGKILAKGSAYSSAKLQDWVDARLAELLPNASRPIKFKDLVLPTWVVATDLSGRRPKVWSTEATPDEYVAMAVRCSCSIPLFFEPVEAGNDFYVDGGMLSNLPSFVFANRENKALGGRILAFQLVANEDHTTQWTLGWLVNRLIDTAISGAANLQREMQSNVSYIQIKTGDVSSMNFDISKDEVEFLLKSGRNALLDFIRNEHTKLDDSLSRDVARYGDDEVFDDLVREMATPGKRLLISCLDTRWFWALYPSIAHWMFAGAAVDVVVKVGANSAREQQRKNLLLKMGARIVEVDKPPVTCFVLNRTDDAHNSAFVLNISETPYAPKAAVYIGPQHRPVIETLAMAVGQCFAAQTVKRPALKLVASDPAKLISLLKSGVNQYGDPRVSIEMRTISLPAPSQPVRMIVRRVRSFKYRQIPHLIALYDRFAIPFCAPADIYAGDEYVSTITPPVLEQWGNELIAVEGNTRIYYLNRMGVQAFQALVVKGVSEPLPGIPVDLRQALIATYDLGSDERIDKFQYKNFRSIEGAVRPDSP